MTLLLSQVPNIQSFKISQISTREYALLGTMFEYELCHGPGTGLPRFESLRSLTFTAVEYISGGMPGEGWAHGSTRPTTWTGYCLDLA